MLKCVVYMCNEEKKSEHQPKLLADGSNDAISQTLSHVVVLHYTADNFLWNTLIEKLLMVINIYFS